MAVLRVLLAVLLMAVFGAARSAVGSPDEYQVKAVFLYNFTRFVEWPASAFENAGAPFVLGVLGHDPFGPHLDEAVRGETVGGHPIVIRRGTSMAELAGCHLVFMHQSEAGRLDELLAAARDTSTLTVSDLPGAAPRGVMIRLVTEQGRVRLRINLEAARDARLTISSNLLRSAEIVRGRP